MTRETRELLARALKLSVEERAELAKSLVASIDEEGGEDSASAQKWGAEIARRIREIDEERVQGIPHEEVMADVRERLQRARKRRKK